MTRWHHGRFFWLLAGCIAFYLFGHAYRAHAATSCRLHAATKTMTVTLCTTPLGLGRCQLFYRVRLTDGNQDHFGGPVPCKTGNGVSPDSRRPL